MTRLATFGYSEFFAQQIAYLPDHLVAARVVGQHRREWDVATEDGTTRAVLAGKRWDPEQGRDVADTQPTVGDWVALRPGDLGAPPVIEHMLKRRTWLTRTSLAKRGARQTLVANIDVVAVVAAFAHPDSDDTAARRSLQPRRIERYLTAIQKGGAMPLILLNKSDLNEASEKTARQLESRLKSCSVVSVNCISEEGLKPLLEHVAVGTTIGFVGLSGVGKSSIVNQLLGREAQKIGAERASDSRGRHTTTHRELFQTKSGLILIDTPGMREFALVGANEADLEAFSDITALSARCQFRNCAHRDEPGCQVLDAVKRGELEQDRLESYRTLSLELSAADKTNARRKAGGAKRRVSRPNRNEPPTVRESQSWDED